MYTVCILDNVEKMDFGQKKGDFIIIVYFGKFTQNTSFFAKNLLNLII